MRLVFFDLDGTLVEQPSSWETLHRHFGVDMETVHEYRSQFLSGVFPYEEWMRREIWLWMSKRPRMEEVARVLETYTLSRNVVRAVAALRQECKFFIVSSGIDLLAKMVSRDLGLDSYYANGLVAHDGFLTGDGIARVDPQRKHEVVSAVCDSLGMGRDDAVGVGDGTFDISLFRGCGTSIAYRPKEEAVSEAADACIQDFSELPPLIAGRRGTRR